MLLACGVSAFGSALAQTTGPAPPPAAASAASSPRTAQLAQVIVTGNPLGSTELAAPTSVLSGDELVLRKGSSLGETLDGQPGVSSTYFGPNANRPIIRGFDGDRIRILNNSGATYDASSLSFDHAVPIDPLVIERLEVLRGPSALLYGGNAIGGVVNAIDNRIPKYSLTGVSGAAEVRLGGPESERGASALVETGNGDFALHVDAFKRKTDDLRVPTYTPVDAEGNVLDRTNHVRNSASDSDGGSVGAAYTFRFGYVGLSADTYRSDYGSTAEEGVIIKMDRDRYALSGEVRDLSGPFTTLRAQVNHTNYQHQEIEDTGEVGTTFKTSGNEVRIEGEHAPLGPVKGVIGAQFENFDFSALGEEAFVPTTNTHRQALFFLEEWASPVGKLSFGGRVERARVSSDGDADPADDKFGPPQERKFTLTSASIGDVYALSPEWSVSGSFSTTARAPTAFELFANGVHAATGAFEVGDPNLGIERGNNVDLALQWKTEKSHARLGVFAAQFSNYISLEDTGTSFTDGEETFPIFDFRGVRARFTGVEFEGSHRLLDGGWALDLTAKADYTKATNRDTGEPLPRIAPFRTTVGLDAHTGPWVGRVEVEYASWQDRVPATDSETASYTLVNLALARHFDLMGSDAYAFFKVNNLTDKLAYSATTVETIRGLVPLPGRGFKAGVRVNF